MPLNVYIIQSGERVIKSHEHGTAQTPPIMQQVCIIQIQETGKYQGRLIFRDKQPAVSHPSANPYRVMTYDIWYREKEK